MEPHKVLVEEVCSGNAAALGAEELEAAAEFQEGLLRVLEKTNAKKNTEADDGELSEIVADRPVLPELGAKVQTRVNSPPARLVSRNATVENGTSAGCNHSRSVIDPGDTYDVRKDCRGN